jgi:signal transduction histidine kinase
MAVSPRRGGIKFFLRLPGLAAAGAVVLATLLLSAWIIGGPLPLAWGHETLIVWPLTCLGLLVAGGSLWFGRDRALPMWSLIVSRVLAALLVAWAAVFAFEAVANRDFGLDRLIFGPEIAGHGWMPGRPAVNASIALLLLGLALATMDIELKRGRRPAQWAATVALLIAFTAIVGYVNGAAHLYNLAHTGGMAIFTAIAVAALSVGVIFARRTAGLAAILVDDAAGGVLARRLLPAAVLLPIALGWLWLWGQRAGAWDRADGPSVFIVASSVSLVWLVARSARVVHATDVQRARLLVREQAARRDAESANRSKGDFLAVMSHELRTPLSAIIGYQELLADGITGPVTEAQQQQLGRIKVSARHLLQLIDEILTYSRAEAGKEEVRYDVAGVNGILDEAAALIEPLAAEKGVIFSLDRLDTPLSIHTDPHKVRQILVNLLSNAVKFTEAGGNVWLRARAADREIELSIGDTGIGIAPEFLDRIFDPFWQVEQKATRRAGGTGLGLSVSRRLARLLGGDIAVTSAVGRGSVFAVTLPARVATQTASGKWIIWGGADRGSTHAVEARTSQPQEAATAGS